LNDKVSQIAALIDGDAPDPQGESFDEQADARALALRDENPPPLPALRDDESMRLRASVDGRLDNGEALSVIGRAIAKPPPRLPYDERHLQQAQLDLGPALERYQATMLAAQRLEEMGQPAKAALALQDAHALARQLAQPVQAYQFGVRALQQQREAERLFEAARRIVDKHSWVTDAKRWGRLVEWAKRQYGITHEGQIFEADEQMIDTALSLYEQTHGIESAPGGLRKFAKRMRGSRTVSQVKQKKAEGTLTRDQQVAAVSALLRGR
jgi:hypothetical protein